MSDQGCSRAIQIFGSTQPDADRRRPQVLRFLGEQTHPLWNTTEPFEDRAGQCIFLCHEDNRSSSWAIQVPCLRPTDERYIVRRTFCKAIVDGQQYFQESANDTITYRKHSHRETAYECDATIFQRLQQACLQTQPWWRKFLPFWGMTEFKEVIVSSLNSIPSAKLTSGAIVYISWHCEFRWPFRSPYVFS